MDYSSIRNFSIIAHIDHGKSTLADRLLEVTNTIEKRKMRDQVLDSMELERERGITIKMQPVRMNYESRVMNNESDLNHDSQTIIHNSSDSAQSFVLNLIDTPGHIDFSYEVSRALKAVEGCLLLVDATQGIQAQTLTTLSLAKQNNLAIIPVLNKIDSPLARISDVEEEMIRLLDCRADDIVHTSGKTGEGVPDLLEEIVKRIPSPQVFENTSLPQALVFDFQYSNHKGIILYVRIFSGKFSRGDILKLRVANERFIAGEIGIFSPEMKPVDSLSSGEIGYIVSGIKKPGVVLIGDTVTTEKNQAPVLSGYQNPKPMVWASVYPESQDEFDSLRHALLRLKLTDSSLSFEEEHSGSLGRGFRCGFLGMLHLEIITERLKREFDLRLIVTTPSINYDVKLKNGKMIKVYTPSLFPDHGDIEEIREPWARVKIISPPVYIGEILKRVHSREAEIGETENFGDNRMSVTLLMPLRELMRHFFDEIKSASSGYASLSYELIGMKEANVTRLDILVAEEPVPAFARVVSVEKAEEEAESAAERLYNILPRQMFVTKIQAKALGRIISSRTISALRKDVTGYLYGGDITRKMKLLEKQKRGKKKMKERGKVNIPSEAFLKMLRSDL